NVRNQVAQNPRVQNVGTQNGLIGVQENVIQNQIGNGNLVAARTEGNAAGQNANQISAPVYDSDGSAEVHENDDNDEIFNMFAQEESVGLLTPVSLVTSITGTPVVVARVVVVATVVVITASPV
nr:hypothetical protein [Tanacetum cinerariifolium]